MLNRIILPALAALVLVAAPARAACPADASSRLAALAEGAAAGRETLQTLSEAATGYVTACGEDRLVLSQILAMFAAAGLAIEPPDPDRFQAQLFAFRTINRIVRAGGAAFAADPATGWSVDDERNNVWDLMFAMSGDFLVYGAHADLYTPGKLEGIGCGLYPAEEASALARQGRGNLDGGELLARIVYLGRNCDKDDRETSGYAARYFAEHAAARTVDPDGYNGLTEADIRAGLASFLDRHLDGAGESWLFDADEVTRLRAF